MIVPLNPKPLSLTDVLKFHKRKASEAHRNQHRSRESPLKVKFWHAEAELHQNLADAVLATIVAMDSRADKPAFYTIQGKHPDKKFYVPSCCADTAELVGEKLVALALEREGIRATAPELLKLMGWKIIPVYVD